VIPMPIEHRFCSIRGWKIITVLNRMACSFEEPGFYPFVMPRAVIRKLHFVHLVAASATR
jgi:hypothetical protein